MGKKDVIAIFDIGKTNKKLLLFDEDFQVVHSESVQLDEVKDEDGFPCEDIYALTDWVQNSFKTIAKSPTVFNIKAINFSGYGASLVHLGKDGKPLLPLYNYLKPYPEALLRKFYDEYGGEKKFARQTASPVLGSLNSGMQLYRVKYEKQEIFSQIKYVLHLPQYISSLISGHFDTDITSVGCHTNLWDFTKAAYHDWVITEGLFEKFPPIVPSEKKYRKEGSGIEVGVGLHDSSAALVPYFFYSKEPFLLLSTGTWCISLNPFNQEPLTDDELGYDCLCYLSYQGKAVKASRLFAGREHEEQVKRLASHFHKPIEYYNELVFDSRWIGENLHADKVGSSKSGNALIGKSLFAERDLSLFENYEQAYHQLINDIMAQQVFSTDLVLKNSDVKKIFVDGGFSKNSIYMNLLAKAYPDMKVLAASMAQASALGAALMVLGGKIEEEKISLLGNFVEY